MRPQLIIDYGGRVLSALLVTADGQLVPCSQEIRQVATRHVSADILFDPRVIEDRDFAWEDALESLAKAGAQNFFQRARRVGLRRPWDAQASADTLQLASPLSVLSSPTALADRAAAVALPRVAQALVAALLDPVFAFLGDCQLTPHEVDLVVVLPGQAGRHARLVLEKLCRGRGFRRPLFIRREVAAAMTLVERSPCECVVVETSENDLHLHRVSIDGDPGEYRFQTAASITLRGLGWSHWVSRIAAALRTTPSAAFDRSLTALLSGSPETLPDRLTSGALDAVLDDAWVAAHDLADRLREPLAELDAGHLPVVPAGEIFGLAAVRRLFGAFAVDVPALDQVVRGVARAMQSRVIFLRSGTLRVNTLRGDTAEVLGYPQLPAAGEACHVDADFRLAGDTGKSFLIHLLWGTDRAPEGNATLCAMPLELRGHDELRLRVHLRRSGTGRRLYGTAEARVPRDVVVARTHFATELEVTR